jgi:hypothetical protein
MYYKSINRSVSILNCQCALPSVNKLLIISDLVYSPVMVVLVMNLQLELQMNYGSGNCLLRARENKYLIWITGGTAKLLMICLPIYLFLFSYSK